MARKTLIGMEKHFCLIEMVKDLQMAGCLAVDQLKAVPQVVAQLKVGLRVAARWKVLQQVVGQLKAVSRLKLLQRAGLPAVDQWKACSYYRIH